MPRMIKGENNVYYFIETEQEKEMRLLKEENAVLKQAIAEMQGRVKLLDKTWIPKNDVMKPRQ